MTSDKNIRVRFAPSPTGPLHIGGVRTAYYNYLFARKMGGTFILRIEDTDQTRYVPGAEDYIINALEWLGMSPDESVTKGGAHGPYRQSERRDLYKTHVDQLIESENAYYAFDSAEDLEEMRIREKEAGNHTPKYDQRIRMTMKNSLTLSKEEVEALLEIGENITVRMKVPENEVISFNDVIRGDVSFNSSELDDKVILKADGLPTYHLANVVDDRTMEISHVIRGEEWLSSTAHHVLLYRSFGWEDEKPVFAHLPLILKPSGKGKLSKRDGAKFGFPVFPMDWFDEKENVTFDGFKERGFMPEALLNFLVLLGWNPGTDQEIFDTEEVTGLFGLDHIHKSGAQFNYEKAQWFNQQYINKSDAADLYHLVKDDFENIDHEYVEKVIEQLKPRVTYLSDFIKSSGFFFNAPAAYDEAAIRKKYKLENEDHFREIGEAILNSGQESESIQQAVKGYITDNELKFGAILPALRIFITGSMSGPDLFEMISLIGKSECVDRINNGMASARQIIENG